MCKNWGHSGRYERRGGMNKSLREIERELEEKYKRPFKIRTYYEEPLGNSAEYVPEEDTIYIGRGIRGCRRLLIIAHEVGHKLQWDELRQKIGEPLPRRPELECDAWHRGLKLAEEWGVKDKYIEHWRDDIFLGVSSCAPPGDKPHLQGAVW